MPSLAEIWQLYLRRFAIEHWYRLVKQTLHPTFRRCGSDFFISCENLEAKRFWAEIMQC